MIRSKKSFNFLVWTLVDWIEDARNEYVTAELDYYFILTA